MSFDAIRWAWEQDVKPAMRKLVLLAMADCVNAEAGEMVCWPSYAFLAKRTGMNTRTVETSVYDLKKEGLLVDTGRRAGTTGKVVVYRLNTPESGGIKPGPQAPDANGTRPQNTPEIGGIGSIGNPPKSDANPPKSDGQSPQKVQETPPKTGAVTSKRTRDGTKKESGIDGAAVPGVAPKLMADWIAVRTDKKARTLTDTAIEGLQREAGKAGLTAEEAVRYCIDANWISFNAGFYAKREGKTSAQPTNRRPTSHAGLADKDYHQGVTSDGTLA